MSGEIIETDGPRPDFDNNESFIPVAIVDGDDPLVEWFTPRQFRNQFGYPHGEPQAVVQPTVLEEINQKQRLRLTKPRIEAFDRLARLWNGEIINQNDCHLIADKIPSWEQLFDGLELQHLEAMKTEVSSGDNKIIESIGEYNWVDAEVRKRSHLKPTTVLRRRVEYDIAESGRTLINEREELPNLAGDPHEGLKHRVGVGLEAARATCIHGRNIETYADIGRNQYTVDLLEEDGSRSIVCEVLTDHNNNQLYRSTMDKIAELERPAVLIFDSRTTLRRVCNHWQNNGYDVPGAPFSSSPQMGWLQDKFREAAHDYHHDWFVEDIFTITQLGNLVFDNDLIGREDIISLDW